MAGLVVFNALMQSVLLGLFAFAGTIPARIAILFFVVSMTATTTTYAFIKLGFNLRLKDKAMLIPQLVIQALLQLGFLLLAPNLSVLFLLILAIGASYAAIDFTPRQFTIGWIIYGVSTAVVLWFVRDRFGYPGGTAPEIMLVWLCFFLGLRSLTLASARFSSMRDKLSEKNRQLNESLRQIEEMASRDYLTGVFNRRGLTDLLEAELQRVQRGDQPFCFLMLDLDLDYFKQINDQFGHPVGDTVLKIFCDLAMQSLRVTDRLGRFGGEEFGVILPMTSLDNGVTSVERLRAVINGYAWNQIAPGLVVQFSAGVAGYMLEDTVQTLVARADETLYQTKRTGRDRTVVAAGHLSTGTV